MSRKSRPWALFVASETIGEDYRVAVFAETFRSVVAKLGYRCSATELQSDFALTRVLNSKWRFRFSALWLMLQIVLFRPKIIFAVEPEALRVVYRVRSIVRSTVIYDLHEIYEHRFATPRAVRDRLREVHSVALHSVDAIVSVNESVIDFYQREYSGDRSLRTLALPTYKKNRVDPDVVAERLRNYQKGHHLRAVYVGGLTPGRGLVRAMRAASMVPRFSLDLIGEGRSSGRLSKLSKRYTAAKMLPRANYEHIPELLEHYQFGLVPYVPNCLNHKHALPQKLFDFLASGLPVIAADLPEVRRFVQSNKVGWIYNPSDERSLERCLSEITFEDYRDTLERLVKLADEISWERRGSAILGRLIEDVCVQTSNQS